MSGIERYAVISKSDWVIRECGEFLANPIEDNRPVWLEKVREPAQGGGTLGLGGSVRTAFHMRGVLGLEGARFSTTLGARGCSPTQSTGLLHVGAAWAIQRERRAWPLHSSGGAVQGPWHCAQ